MPFVAAIATWTASIRAFGGSAPVRSSAFAPHAEHADRFACAVQ
jgi:hypothetical protein